MTNLDKLRAVEISGAKLFAHLTIDDAVCLLGNIKCKDCPADCGEWPCSDNLREWLRADA